MYIVIDTTTYTEISGLEFNPVADLTGSTVPINELWVSIHTDDAISVGSRVYLYDDTDVLWAKYWVTYAEVEAFGFRRVHGQSALFKLDQNTLDPILYDGTSVASAIEAVLGGIGDYTLDEAFDSETLSGFCPKQTARVRLQWICMAIGAYIKEFFTDRITILPYSSEPEIFVDSSRVFWKPTVQYKDYVTRIEATYYDYDEGMPSRLDDYVEANDTTYIQRSDELSVSNPDVPQIALENVMTIDKMTLLNIYNVDMVLQRQALYAYKRLTVELDIIDNGDVIPGQTITTYSAEDEIITGFVKSASFSFGMRARASLEVEACEVREGAWLTVNYVWGEMAVGMKRFYLPVGYPYSTDNPYLDVTFQDGHKYILRPVNASTSGTMVSGGVTVTEDMEVALEYFEGTLYTRSVDEITVQSDSSYGGNVVSIS